MPRPTLTRRQLGLGLLGLSTSLAGCGRMHKRYPAGRISAYYERDDLAGVESLMPDNSKVAINELVFHDWAYPNPARLDATQDDPGAWREVTSRDEEGGPAYHGIKLRLPGEHDDDQLHRSGPKLIAFLPTTDDHSAALLEQAYRERFELICTVSWIGVLDQRIWIEGEVLEDDMVGLHLHNVRRVY